MKKTILLSTGISLGAAIILSVFVREDGMARLSSIAVGLIALACTVAGCIWPSRPRWQTLARWMIPAAVFISVLASQLPLRTVFRIYRAEFNEAATLIESGTPPAGPFSIGPFRIETTGRRTNSGTPYLATSKDTSELEGFVKHPEGHGFNIWSCVTLDDSWSYIAED